jgi:curved DNA-binding protein CbpA
MASYVYLINLEVIKNKLLQMENIVKNLSILLSLVVAFSGISIGAMQSPTHYDILGVSKDATQEEIKQAYRKLGQKYHPNGMHYQSLNEEDKKYADSMFKMADNAYKTLSDDQAKRTYDAGGTNPTYTTDANQYNDAQDHILLMGSVFAAKKTYNYLTLAWEQYRFQQHFADIKKHIKTQLKNIENNQPIAPIRTKLDLKWILELRQNEQPSAIERALNQFDTLAMQNPRALPQICPQIMQAIDMYTNAIGSSSTSVLKATAIASIAAVSYVYADKWLPYLDQLLRSRLFSIGLRLFS